MWRIPHVKPGAYRRARDALHACVTPLLRCCFVGLFCGVLSALSPVVGSCAATVASYGVVITASRLAPAAHGPDCRQATILGVVCATAILVSPLAGMGAACFLAVCPTSCLWWPSPPATVQVKRGKTEKQRPFFFVRLRIDGQELCGPRHVTEEAAKRDKESLNGKPIVEQRAIIERLRSGEQESPRKRQRQESSTTPRKRQRQGSSTSPKVAGTPRSPATRGTPRRKDGHKDRALICMLAWLSM